jgi:GTP-binding protein Era
MSEGYRCGFVAIVGRPNVGKSTLLNTLLGQKISITSRKSQTTRQQILGIKTTKDAQIIYIDTPGLHRRRGRALNRYMNREVTRAIAEVDVIVFLIEALRWTDEDQFVFRQIERASRPIILAVNKVDRVPDKARLLPFIKEMAGRMAYAEIIPLSGLTGKNISDLEKEITARLPAASPLFPDDQVTDRSERFFAAELIREKLLRRLHQEVPHRLSVAIEDFKQKNGILHIHGTIWVERPGQKQIAIGRGGSVLKAVGEEARRDMERMFGEKVFLKTWVKVREDWSDYERALREFGFDAN